MLPKDHAEQVAGHGEGEVRYYDANLPYLRLLYAMLLSSLRVNFEVRRFLNAGCALSFLVDSAGLHRPYLRSSKAIEAHSD